MALNLNDRITIMRGDAMQTRVSAAVAKYALHILGGGGLAGGVDQENAEGWAREALRNPTNVGRDVSWHLLDNPKFLGSGTDPLTGNSWVGGSDIPDADMQSAVESAVNARFIAAGA